MPGSSDYIQNGTTAQPGINFSIGGAGSFALVLFNKSSHQLSVNILNGYLERNPNDFKAHQLRALAYRKLGKTAESKADEAAARRIVEGK